MAANSENYDSVLRHMHVKIVNKCIYHDCATSSLGCYVIVILVTMLH